MTASLRPAPAGGARRAIEEAGFEVAAASGLSPTPDGFVVEDAAACLRLAPPRPLQPGLYEVAVTFGASPLSGAVFELEFGGTPPRAIPLAYLGRGRFRSVCHVPDPLSALLIRPNAPGERLVLDALHLRRLGALARLRLLGGRALALLRQDPRALIGAARRYRAGVTRGDVIVARGGPERRPGDYGAWLATFDDDPARDEPLYRERLARAGPLPSFSILLPIDRLAWPALRQTVASARAQLHGDWELHLVAAADLKPQLAGLVAAGPEADPRIRLLLGRPGDGLEAGLNDALAQGTGGWALRLRPGDILRPHALAEVALAIGRDPALGLVYTDEDGLDRDGLRHAPYFKPDWSPDLLRSWNYLGEAVAAKADLIVAAGGWRAGYGEAREHDLNLRLTERLPAGGVGHIAKVLVHRGASSATPAPGTPIDPEAAAAGARAVAEHLARTGQCATVAPVAGGSVLRVRYGLPSPAPLVSIVVPTRDRVALLRGCIGSILAKTTYAPFEILVVDNNSAEPETLAFLREIEADARVRVVPYPEPFNFAAINNFAVSAARGTLVALVNNDVEVVTPDWLDEMAAHALRPEIGCVGAKLCYPDGTVQHAGIVLGLGGLAGHAHKGLPGQAPGYVGRAAAVCNVSAVTAACLVMRRALYEAVGGLDAADLAIAFNDVDLCLKVRERGYLNLWTPFAELLHHESASRGAETSRPQAERFGREVDAVKRRWGRALLSDPYYSPHLTVLREDYSFRP